MTVTEVLKAEAGQSTVTGGYSSGYELRRNGQIVGFAQARLVNWRLTWSVAKWAGDKVEQQSSVSLTDLLTPFGNVDLVRTEITNSDEFFRVHRPS